jgi:hypothetical protein
MAGQTGSDLDLEVSGVNQSYYLTFLPGDH